jgi:hypothetical protein
VAAHRIPVDAYVWTTRGPCRVGDLHGGEVAIVNTNGRVTTSAVISMSPATERPVVRLRTAAGEIHLEARTAITTRGARLFGATAAAEAAGGRQLRIELALPQDLPAPDSDDVRGGIRTALGLLDPPVVRVPRRLGMSQQLAEILRTAEVAYVDASDERWTALCFDADAVTGPAGPVAANEAGVLQAITAWAHPEPGRTESRTTLEQGILRQRLVAALAASGTPASVTWTPGYGPVEARITASRGGPFTLTKGAETTVMPCVDITVADAGSAITDLAIVAARRGQIGD